MNHGAKERRSRLPGLLVRAWSPQAPEEERRPWVESEWEGRMLVRYWVAEPLLPLARFCGPVTLVLSRGLVRDPRSLRCTVATRSAGYARKPDPDAAMTAIFKAPEEADEEERCAMETYLGETTAQIVEDALGRGEHEAFDLARWIYAVGRPAEANPIHTAVNRFAKNSGAEE